MRKHEVGSISFQSLANILRLGWPLVKLCYLKNWNADYLRLPALKKYKISTIPDCSSDLITSWFVMRRNEKKKTKRKINLQSFSLWEQISFGKLIPIEKKSSGKPAFKLHEIHCIIMINVQYEQTEAWRIICFCLTLSLRFYL